MSSKCYTKTTCKINMQNQIMLHNFIKLVHHTYSESKYKEKATCKH